MASYIIQGGVSKGNDCMFIADRIKLVDQTLQAFDVHGIDLGVLQGIHERHNPQAPVQIASIQTLSRRKIKPTAKIYIYDECHTNNE